MIPRTVRYTTRFNSRHQYGQLVGWVQGGSNIMGILLTKEGRYDTTEIQNISDGDEKAHTEREAHRAIEMEFGHEAG